MYFTSQSSLVEFIPDRVEEKRKEVEGNDDDDESWIRVTSRFIIITTVN